MSATVTSKFLAGQIYRAANVNGPTTSSTTGYTAFAGGGQAGATALQTAISHVTTVTTSGDSVVLGFPATAGIFGVAVINDTANALQLFGLGNDTIKNAAANVGVSVPGGSMMVLWCPTSGAWFGGLLT